jgi:hypothetical protein
VLDGLFLGAAIDAVAEALRSAPAGAIAVVGHSRLARGLAERGLDVIAVDDQARPLRRLTKAQKRGARGDAVRARGDALPLASRAVSAIVGWGAGGRADWAEVLAEWSRPVADGGIVVMVDRAPSTELSRRALCSGLAELQQRPAGRLVVTSGIVTDL